MIVGRRACPNFLSSRDEGGATTGRAELLRRSGARAAAALSATYRIRRDADEECSRRGARPRRRRPPPRGTGGRRRCRRATAEACGPASARPAGFGRGADSSPSESTRVRVLGPAFDPSHSIRIFRSESLESSAPHGRQQLA